MRVHGKRGLRRAVPDARARYGDQRGIEPVTKDETARAAGVGKGTLYRRYPEKAALASS
jgi:AcrR family transcriptional regulator